MDLNYLDHVTINDALLLNGVTTVFFPIGSENGFSEIWLEMHERMHQAIDDSLNIDHADFSFLDMKDESSFRDWLKTHYDQHVLYEQSLGL